MLGRFALCTKVSSDPITFLITMLIFFRFSRTKISFDRFQFKPLFNINKPCILGFYIMKNNINKAPVKLGRSVYAEFLL